MTGSPSTPLTGVWIGPDRPDPLVAAVQPSGLLAPSPETADVLVWTEGPDGIAEVLHPRIRWVQLPSAGVETWLARGTLDRDRTWTTASPAFGQEVAEHALALVLAAAKGLPHAARERSWTDVESRAVRGSTVGVVGAGAIGRATLQLLRPLGAQLIATTRSGRPVPEADLALPATGLEELLTLSDFVVLAAPLTEQTSALIGADELGLLGSGGSLINVARGRLVDTEALTAALSEGRIASACLDVTDPEPLPSDHELWRLPNALITPHIANPPGGHFKALAWLVTENLDRFQHGRELLGVIDLDRGY